jgi:hypothetical protein
MSFTVDKISQIIWATSIIFDKLPKVNKRPLGENSLNLVTLVVPVSWCLSSVETTSTAGGHLPRTACQAYNGPRAPSYISGSVPLCLFCILYPLFDIICSLNKVGFFLGIILAYYVKCCEAFSVRILNLLRTSMGYIWRWKTEDQCIIMVRIFLRSPCLTGYPYLCSKRAAAVTVCPLETAAGSRVTSYLHSVFSFQNFQLWRVYFGVPLNIKYWYTYFIAIWCFYDHIV